MGAAAAIAKFAGFGEGQADAVAIGPGIARENPDFCGYGDRGPAQCFAENLLFEVQLGGVIGVLIVTASAGAEVGTSWCDAAGRGGEDLVHFGFGEAAFLFGDVRGDRLTGERERGEDGFACLRGVADGPGQAIAAIDGFFHR